jgi:hypothetical protein
MRLPTRWIFGTCGFFVQPDDPLRRIDPLWSSHDLLYSAEDLHSPDVGAIQSKDIGHSLSTVVFLS